MTAALRACIEERPGAVRVRSARASADVARRRAIVGVLAGALAEAQLDVDRAALDTIVHLALDPDRFARGPRELIARTAAAFGCSAEEIVGERRSPVIVRARYAAIAAVREAHPGYGVGRLARIFRRDHTTILYAFRRMAELGVPQPPAPPEAS